ncbi:hypothetical protein AK812_SmicGene30570 [Symbiodinium microadriaticum]|uniref:Uncharacterized protein n=1 Tax=Symbiodinium microadriaticum TaxID=2951 RepID=A0A1Q9CYW4_SYMMI|nr:hypothetical protein AK812_SmicGene30570 [Symbiodinium microadriaticum]CAE7219516.1 unnamed protein product [Symbiodinium microadriaticum]CAE7948859.1 unnamed protein product [Symbiodinium sp. KB8]
MVRQEDVDNLFAKPGTVRRHCLLLSACIVFDVTIYPLMIWFLFIDVPAFLQAPPREEDERMFLFIKLGAVCGFTFVVCMYQVILFDLFGQHCSRMRQALSMEQKPLPETRAEDAEGKHLEAWDTRPDDGAGQPKLAESDSILALPGALYPQHLGMPAIEEAPESTVVQMVTPFQSQSRTMSRNPSGDERGRVSAAAARKYHSEGQDTAARAPLQSLTDGGSGDENDRSGTKKSAAKPHEKTVSFDRETVFTYIKQTPVQTPR